MRFAFAARVLRRFTNVTGLKVAREVAPTYVDGIPTPGGWEVVTIARAFVYPLRVSQLGGRATHGLHVLPEGARERGVLGVSVEAGLGTGYAELARGNVFAYGGATYRIIEVTDWRPGAGVLDAVGVRQESDATTLDAWIFGEGGLA